MKNKFHISESTAEERNLVFRKINDFNKNKVPFTQSPDSIFFNYNIKNEKGEIIGGITSSMHGWNIIFVDVLFIDESYRHHGLGSALIAHLEKEAKAKGCYLIILDTFDFQAKDFYLKLGFKVIGTIDDCPPGHQRFYLTKRI